MSVLSKLKELFHICDHRWVEVRRTKVYRYYSLYPIDSDSIPDETKFVIIELKCSRCGAIKVKKIKF